MYPAFWDVLSYFLLMCISANLSVECVDGLCYIAMMSPPLFCSCFPSVHIFVVLDLCEFFSCIVMSGGMSCGFFSS